MKKCPVCKKIYDSENDFCFDDGTPLIPEAPSQAPGGMYPSGDMPTQYISRPPTETRPAGGSSSNVLYLVIGILATALVGLGAYMFLLRDNGNQSGTANRASPQANSANTAPSPQATTGNMANIADASPPPPAAAPNPAVSGRWTGDISYPSGSAFSAQADLTETGNGQVRGQIVWTLLRTSNSEKREKVGLSATEFVQGSFDSSGRTLSLSGYDETDPADIIIKDKYRLAVAADGRNMSGSSLGGKKSGRVSLRRY